jgi:hypothetical protein
MSLRPGFSRGALFLLVGLAACSPTFNWREVRPTADLVALFPCKPDVTSRTLQLAGASVAARMMSCSSGGMTFAVLHAHMAKPALLAPAMVELRAAAVTNLGRTSVSVPKESMTSFKGTLPVQRLALSGQRPDGLEIQSRVVLFAHGLNVYQATVSGNSIDADAVDTFVSGLALPR